MQGATLLFCAIAALLGFTRLLHADGLGVEGFDHRGLSAICERFVRLGIGIRVAWLCFGVVGGWSRVWAVLYYAKSGRATGSPVQLFGYFGNFFHTAIILITYLEPFICGSYYIICDLFMSGLCGIPQVDRL